MMMGMMAQGVAAVIGHSEAEKSVVGSGAVAEEFGKHLPVERRVRELAQANPHVAAHVWHDTQVVSHVQLRLAPTVVQLTVTRQCQLNHLTFIC